MILKKAIILFLLLVSQNCHPCWWLFCPKKRGTRKEFSISSPTNQKKSSVEIDESSVDEAIRKLKKHFGFQFLLNLELAIRSLSNALIIYADDCSSPTKKRIIDHALREATSYERQFAGLRMEKTPEHQNVIGILNLIMFQKYGDKETAESAFVALSLIKEISKNDKILILLENLEESEEDKLKNLPKCLCITEIRDVYSRREFIAESSLEPGIYSNQSKQFGL